MGTNSDKHFCVFQLDQLEPRRMMAAELPLANVDQGTLIINATSGNDSIRVFNPRKNGIIDLTTIVVRENGQEKSFSTGGIHLAVIGAEAGNDDVEIAPGLAFDLFRIPFYVNGGSGNDTIVGGDGDDTLTGAGGSDHIDGRGGRDRLNGLDGNDVLNGGDGVDRLFGGAGNDLLNGGKSTDYIYGEGGNDTVLGSDGQDWLDGGSGNDSIDGDGGDDTIFGESGNDTLIGGTGHDFVFGNSGDDNLQLRDLTSDNADGGSGIDKAVIDDFERAFIVAETRAQ